MGSDGRMAAFYLLMLTVSLMSIGGLSLLIILGENVIIGIVVSIPSIYSIYIASDRFFRIVDARVKSR
jgi:hypothetical protein